LSERKVHEVGLFDRQIAQNVTFLLVKCIESTICVRWDENHYGLRSI